MSEKQPTVPTNNDKLQDVLQKISEEGLENLSGGIDFGLFGKTGGAVKAAAE